MSAGFMQYLLKTLYISGAGGQIRLHVPTFFVPGMCLKRDVGLNTVQAIIRAKLL